MTLMLPKFLNAIRNQFHIGYNYNINNSHECSHRKLYKTLALSQTHVVI